jgi:hypothetical protein
VPAQSAKNFLLWFLRPFYSRERHYWKVVLLCLVAASTFWLLNALNKSYTNIRTDYPLRFVYNQDKLIPLEPLPENIEINVNGKGWKLLRKNLKLDARPVEIVVQSVPRRNFFTGQALRSNVAGVLDGLQLNFVVTDTVRFKFDRRLRREIPVKVDSSQLKTTENAYLSSPVVINPDTVLFDGPASLVAALPSPYPVKLPETELDRSFRRFIPLEYSDKSLVKANVTDVEVSFAVSPLTWEQTEVVLDTQQLPPGKVAALMPGVVKVRYGYVQNNAAPIKPEQFTVAPVYSTYNPADSTVALVVTRKPVQVKRIKVNPGKIKLIPAF